MRTHKLWITLAVLGAAALALAGCGAPDTPGTLSTAPTVGTSHAQKAPAPPKYETVTTGSGPIFAIYDPLDKSVWAVNTNQNTVSIISTATHQVTATEKVGGRPVTALYDPMTKDVYVFNSGDGTTSTLNATTGKLVKTTTATGYAYGGSGLNSLYVPENHLIYSVGIGDGSALYAVSDATTGAAVSVRANPTVTSAPASGGMAYDPDDHRVYLVNRVDNQIEVVSTINNRQIATIPVGSNPTAIAYDPGTHGIYVADEDDGIVHIISAKTGHQIGQIRVDAGGAQTSSSAIYDPVTKKIWVTGFGFASEITPGTGRVRTVRPTRTNHVTTSQVAVDAVDPATGDLYIPSYADGVVTIIPAEHQDTHGMPTPDTTD